MKSEKHTKARSLAATLARELASMTDAEREGVAARMPSVMNPVGHFLSLHNTLFLVEQSGRADITIVAGFKQWIDNGRCVKKGEHAIGFISVPILIKDKYGKKDANGDDKKELRFRLVPVFDVSQTDELQAEAKEPEKEPERLDDYYTSPILHATH